MLSLEKAFNPEKVSSWQQKWEEAGVFRPQGKGEKFIVAIPPPNVTGSLHLGHALNCTIQDLLCRYYRLKGKTVLWLPGTDHAGIATQNVVEKELRQENLSRHDLGREKFLERVWSWKEKYGNRILEQLRALGTSCDFSRTRFTMDEKYTLAVKTAFVRLYQEGLIFRGNKMINFCPRCQTALADIETIREEKKGKLYEIAYPLKGGKGELVVATTRPETMLGDTALAIHPEDTRYRSFLGQTAILPLLQRPLPIIGDESVEREFGTGVLKVTPAHDFHDFELGQKHRLPAIQVISESGMMTKEAGPYQGLDRFEARKKVLEDLKLQNLLREERDYLVPLSTCARCHTVVEPLISMQWFVKTPLLVTAAIEAVEKREIQFFPERFSKFYLEGLKNTREWCISRQIWWGHRIPAWFCEKGCPPTVSLEAPKACASCGSAHLRQDEDVLDTWFSSALWPFAILGWPEKTEDLKMYYPTTLLSTARDIIFLWVARMVMTSKHFLQTIPFSEVIVHPTILNREGKRMSKSLGTGIDPLDLIQKYGADALRLGLMLLIQKGQDVRFSEEPMRAARFFCNKLWNAVRLTLLLTKEHSMSEPDPASSHIFNQWIWHRFHEVREEIEKHYQMRSFADIAMTLYHFFWDEWCDWYLEIAKKKVAEGDSATKDTLLFGTKVLLEWFHPLVPFITEELYHYCISDKLLATATFTPFPAWHFPEAKRKVEELFSLIQAIRRLKASAPAKIEKVTLSSPEPWEELKLYRDIICHLTRVEKIEQSSAPPPKEALTEKSNSFSVYCLLDKRACEAEEKRLKKEREELSALRARALEKIKNPHFLARARKEIVAETQARLQSLEKRLKEIDERLSIFSAKS